MAHAGGGLMKDRDMFRAARHLADDDREVRHDVELQIPDSQRSSKRLYSVADAAEALAIRRKHVYTLISRGELSTVAIGRRRLIPNDELDRYIRQLMNEGG
jgi:excisionase family DNA binding protein